MSEKPWRDKQKLKHLHEEQGHSFREIAEMLGTTHSTISKWCKRYGIEKDRPWRDEETLRKLYVEQKMSVHDIGDKFGVDGMTIHNWLNRLGIGARSVSESAKYSKHRYKPASRYINRAGYVYLRSGGDAILEHRLIAVAKYGFEKVANKQVHHGNGVPWDNRPNNIELVDIDEHARIHYSDRELNDKGQFI